MADVDARAEWLGDLRFRVATADGEVVLDGDGDTSITPVQSLLVALTGCMAADVVDIGRTMRLPLEGLEVEAEADRAAEPPRRFLAVRLRFTVRGVEAADEPKVRRALTLSEEKYCSVLHSLRPDLELRTELRLEPDAETVG